MKYVLIFLLLLPLVSAISVTPAKYELDFEPGLSQTFEFRVKSNSQYDTGATIGLKGDLVEYAALSTTKLEDIEDWAPFTVTVDLPDSVEKPGKNILEVMIVEDIEATSGMAARTAVVPWVVVDVPYPGKYAEIGDLFIEEGLGVNEGKNVSLSFTVRNRGSEIIENATALVELVDQDIIEEHSFEVFILPEEDYNDKIILNTALLTPKAYLARLTFHYDNQTLTKETSFLIGHLNVTLDGRTKEVERVGIVPIILGVKNLWGGIVFVEAILDLEGLQQIKTPEHRLPEFGSDVLTAYLDTSLVEGNNITGTLFLHYYREGGGTFTNTYPFALNITEPEKPVPEEESPIMVILLILGIVILINAFVLVKLWKK